MSRNPPPPVRYAPSKRDVLRLLPVVGAAEDRAEARAEEGAACRAVEATRRRGERVRDYLVLALIGLS